MSTIKTAVLGAGGMGNTVIEHLRQCPRVDGIVAMDVRPERIAELRQRYGIHTTTDLHEVLRDPNISLVFITAPNNAHKELTIRSLEAGKAVMCEKPMATNLADARAMVEAVQHTGGFLQIGFELRYSKLYITVKDWIDQGLLGQVINTHCLYVCSEFHGKNSWRNTPGFGGGMFGEKLSHYVDLSRWWIGLDVPVTEVYSACSPNVVPYYEVRDNYHTTYRFANDAVSHLSFMMAVGATFNGDPLQNVIDQQNGDGHALQYLIEGTKGAAATDVFGRHIKRWEFGDSPQGMTSTWVEDLTWEPDEDHVYFHCTRHQTYDIVERVSKGLPPKISAMDALHTMRLVFAAELSADQGRLVKLDELGTL